MINYKLQKPVWPATESNVILRLPDNAFIPVNEQNRDYKEYLKWVAEGNTPEPADE
jgi:hypothetical protein